MSSWNDKIESLRIKFALKGKEPIDAQELIRKAIIQFGEQLTVSWSAGACSTVVLHMAWKLNPEIKVVLCDTTQLYPQDIYYMRKMRDEWNLNLTVTKPIKPFWKVWREYGAPTIRRQYYHGVKKYGKNRHTFQEKTGKPACCWFCKDKPFLDFCKKENIQATFTGIRCSESVARMYYAQDYGQWHFTKRQKLWKVNPILFWTNKQVQNYFIENHLPKNEVYTKLGLKRNGCMPCTGFIGWRKQLSKVNPKMLKFVLKTFGETQIEDFIIQENEGCKPELGV